MSIHNSSAYGGGISAVDEKKFAYAEDAKAPSDIESGDMSPTYDHEDDFAEKKDLRTGLKQRHIQMIALAGTIGTVRAGMRSPYVSCTNIVSIGSFP